MLFVEELRDLLLALVQRRTDEVRRRLVVIDLEDIFAEVRFDHGQTGGLDGVVERGLLRHHRLRLDDLLHGVPCRDFQNERVGVRGRFREQDLRTPCRRVALEDLEPGIEVVERALADGPRRIARALEVVELDHRRLALLDELGLDFLEIALQPRVVQLDVRVLLEVHRRDLHRYLASPASTSATCNTFVLMSPRRRSRPSMFSMHPKSPKTTASAPESAMFWHLLSASRAEISPNLIENVPPKPQHV